MSFDVALMYGDRLAVALGDTLGQAADVTLVLRPSLRLSG